MPQSKRSPSQGAELRRNARALVSPFVVPIGAWQFRVAMLQSMLHNPGAKALDRASLRPEIDRLAGEVDRTRNNLSAAQAGAPSSVSGSSRVADVTRALSGLSVRLAELRQSVGE